MLNMGLIVLMGNICVIVAIIVDFADIFRNAPRMKLKKQIAVTILVAATICSGLSVMGDLFIEEVEITGRVEEIWTGDGNDIKINGIVLKDTASASLDIMPTQGRTYAFTCLHYTKNSLLSRYEITGVA